MAGSRPFHRILYCAASNFNAIMFYMQKQEKKSLDINKQRKVQFCFLSAVKYLLAVEQEETEHSETVCEPNTDKHREGS